MLDPLSHVEQAYRDTLIRCVEGYEQITNLSRLFGLNYPQGFVEDSWRKALRASAYARRGTIPQIFDFLSGFMHHHTRDILVEATSLNRLTSATNAFADDDYGRLIRLLPEDAANDPRPYADDWTGPVHYSIDVDSSGGYIDLAEISTTYWDAPSLTLNQRYYARVYPFVFAEPTPGRTEPSSSGSGYVVGHSQEQLACKLILSVLGDISEVPATYMVASSGAARTDPNEPYGGHLQPDELTEAGEGVTDHPYPPYIPGNTLADTAKESLDLLMAAGTEALSAAF